MSMCETSNEWSSLPATERDRWVNKAQETKEESQHPTAPSKEFLPGDSPYGLGDVDWPIRAEFFKDVNDCGLRTVAAKWQNLVKSDILPIDIDADPESTCGDLLGPGACSTAMGEDRHKKVLNYRALLVAAASSVKSEARVSLFHVTPVPEGPASSSPILAQPITVLMATALFGKGDVEDEGGTTEARHHVTLVFSRSLSRSFYREEVFISDF